MVFQKNADSTPKGQEEKGEKYKKQMGEETNSSFMEMMNGPAGAVGCSLLMWVVFKTIRHNPDNDKKGTKFQSGSGQTKVFGSKGPM